MKNTTHSVRRMALSFFTIALILTLTATTLRIFNLFFFFNGSLGYYVSGALLPLLEWICLGASVALLLILSLLWFRKQSVGYAEHTPLGVRVGALFGAAGFGLLLIRDVLSYVDALNSDAEWKTGIIPILLCLGAVAYFVLTAWNVRSEAFRLLTGFCVILRLLTSLSNSYFNFLIPMNAPDKLMFQLGVLSAMLFLINEIRALVSKPRPVFYLFSAGIALVFLSASSLPSILAINQGILLDGSNLYCDFALLGLFLYVLFRFLFFCLSPEIEEDTEETKKQTTDTDTSVEENEGAAEAPDSLPSQEEDEPEHPNDSNE